MVLVMLNVLYNDYKGFCVVRKTPFGDESECEEIVTDGFDHFNWSTQEHDDEKSHKSFYDAYNDNETDNSQDESMYDDESKVALNHRSEMSIVSIQQTQTSPQKRKESNKKKISKHQQKLERKKEKRQGKRKGPHKDKNTQYACDHVPSDIKKVKILNNLYKDIITISGKQKMDDKIFQFFDVSIYGEDLVNLKDDEWLSDNNISFVYEYLERYQLVNFDKRLIGDTIQLVRPSMVYLLAQTPEPQILKGVIPPLENGKFLFLPVNDNDDVEAVGAGSHWSLVVISMLDKVAMIYDSMEHANEREARDLITKVEEYLNNCTKFQIRVMETPQQQNGSDCGVMVSQLTGYLTSRLLQLEHLKDHCVDLGLKGVKISPIDGRIFMMGTLLNVYKHKSNI